MDFLIGNQLKNNYGDWFQCIKFETWFKIQKCND